MNDLLDRMIRETDWGRYRVSTGPATHVGQALHDLLTSRSVEESTEAWGKIEEYVFSQGDIFSAAEPTLMIMVASLMDEQPSWRSGRILDLIFFIVNSSPVNDELLHGRCISRAREGLWLLVRWALTHDNWARENALEVIEIIAPECYELIRSTAATE